MIIYHFRYDLNGYMHKFKRLLTTIPSIHWKREKYIDSSWDYNVILLDNTYTVRIPKHQDAVKRVLIDFCLLKFLSSKKKFQIPEPIYLNKKTQLAVYKAVQGRPVTRARYRKMNSRQKNNFAKSLGRFLKTLHTMPIKKIRGCKLPINNLTSINKTIFRDVAIIRPYINQTQKFKLKVFLQERKSVLRNGELVLTHGDLTSDHIFLNNKGLGIIDFSDSAISDPAIDFPGFLCYGSDFVSKVLKYYHSKHSESLIARAQIYYKDIAIKLLAAAVRGSKLVSVQDAKRFFDIRLK